MRQIKVLSHPETFILTDSSEPDEVIITRWIEKYGKGGKPLSQVSKLLETGLIRSAKKLNKIYR